jgi:GAF domain-containing protein
MILIYVMMGLLPLIILFFMTERALGEGAFGQSQAVEEQRTRALIYVRSSAAVMVLLTIGAAVYLGIDAAAPIEWMAETASRIGRVFKDMFQSIDLPPVKGEISRVSSTLGLVEKHLLVEFTSLDKQIRVRTSELNRRTAQLETAAQIARESADVLDVEMLLTKATRLIYERFGYYHAAIFLIDENREYAVIRATNSEGGIQMLGSNYKHRLGDNSLVSWAAKSGQAKVVADITTEIGVAQNPYLPFTRCQMTLPMKARNRVIGVLDIQSTSPAAFNDADEGVLQILADQVALALENARLYEESQQALKELSMMYGQQTLQAWGQRLRQKPVAYLYNRLGVKEAEASILADDPLESDQAARISTEFGYHKLSAPVILRGQVLGAITLRKEADLNPWSEAELRLVSETVEQITPALENARLLAEAQTHASREQAVNVITSQVRSTMNLDAILQNTVRELGKLLGNSRTYIQLGVNDLPGSRHTQVTGNGDGQQVTGNGDGQRRRATGDGQRRRATGDGGGE